MKKLFISFVALAAAAAAIVSCNKNEQEVQTPADGYRYSFIIDESDTRATLDDGGVLWEAGDKVGMYIGTQYTGYANVDNSTSPKTIALYSSSEIAAGTMAYGYYPYTASNNDKTATIINFNNIQQGGSTSAMPMAGIPFEVEEDIEAKSTSGNGVIKFLNLGSIIDFRVYSDDYDDETVQYITFTANDAIVSGNAYIDLTAVNANNESTLALTFNETGENEYDYVKVNEEVPVVTSKSEATSPIYMVVAPGTYSGTITIGTDVATYTFNFTDKVLGRNVIKHFYMNLNNATRVEEVVVVEKTPKYTESFVNGMGDFSISGDTQYWSFDASYGAKVTSFVSSTNNAAETWLISPVLDLTGVDDAQISFDQCINKYFGTVAEEATLWVKEASDEDFTTQLTITYPSISGTATFSSFETQTVNLKNYAGKKIKVAFKYVGKTTAAGTWEIKNFVFDKVKAEAGIVYETTSYEANLGETFTTPTLTNPNNLTVTYSSDDEDVVKVDAQTGAVTLVGAGVAKVTATFVGNDDFNEASASYTITVKDPDATIVVDKLTLATTGVSGNSYTAWSGKTVVSSAIYAGNSAGDKESIQLRSNSSNSGIITTASGGTLKSVTVKWHSDTQSGRTLNVYGKNSAYSSTTDLYTDATAGVLLGTIVMGTSTTLTIDGIYTFIGLRSDSGAMYLTEVDIEWETTAVEIPEYNVTASATNGTVTATPSKVTAGSTVLLTIAPDEGYILSSLSVDGEDVTSDVLDNLYSFSMPAHDVSVVATFEVGEVETVTWVKTAYGDLATGDIVVIVDGTTEKAMSNNNGTSSAPSATAVTISDDTNTLTSTPAETLLWTVTVNDGSYQFGTGDNYLYCTNTNNGVRVGTNTNNAFTFANDDDGNPFLIININTETSRYIGVYNSSDWRCYTSINANIKDTRIVFYKKTTN